MGIVAGLQICGFAGYLRHVRETSRISIEVPPSANAVVTLWHEAMFAVLAATLDSKEVAIYVVGQRGAEGNVRFLKRLGFSVIVALPENSLGVREARRWLDEPNRILAITADGPAGPRRIAKAGVVRLARMARAALYPLRVSASSCIERDTWDRAVVPLPRGLIGLKTLPKISETLALDAATNALQAALVSSDASVVHARSIRDWPARALIKACTSPLTWGNAKVWPETAQGFHYRRASVAVSAEPLKGPSCQ